MIKSANKYFLSEVFPIDKDISYFIPKYQREYNWNKDNWEELLNDIQESHGDHFIGSLICVDRTSDAYKSTILELVDGQQRLTTISLLYAAIYHLLDKNRDQDDKDLDNELYNLRFRLVQKNVKNEVKLELSHQNSNAFDYKSVLKDIGIINFEGDISHRGNRRIYKAYRFFESKLSDYSQQDLLNLLNEINKVLIVKIEVNSHSDAFMLFESLNNRGVPLSAIDLIKNNLLANLEKKQNVSVDEAFDKWKKIIENLRDYSVQERFLRHYYNAFKSNDEVKVQGITRATRSNTIKIYENLIDRDVQVIFDNLYDKSKIYHDLMFPEEENLIISDSYDNILTDLINVKAAPAYELLLYLFSTINKNDDSSEMLLNKTIEFLVKYFIRRNVTDFPSTRNLDQIFIDLIEDMTKDTDKISYQYITQFLSANERMSSMSIFKERLLGDMYEMNIDATRFILSKIEESKSSTKEIHTDFWQRDNSNKLVWTIEHIFPEGNNIPKSWVEMIAKGDKNEAMLLQDTWVHKIGNLTLTGFNSQLSNYDFEKKRDRKDRQGKNIGYKNKLFLNESLYKKDSWTIEDIKHRTNELVDMATEIFKIDHE